MILGSDGFHEHLAQIRISNMTASEDGRNLTIFWSIPEEYMETLGKLGVQGIDVILNNAKKSIRQRLARENAYRKVPTLSFVNAPAGAQFNKSDLEGSPDLSEESSPSATSKWAKMWREKHNAKLIAKRERKRSHQMLGLWQLNKELEELE
ncbi:unnamed protein product [Mesocestoides corti]|uniref:Uncharacterized protein n=1 Tax=Mesocestoides corti TaxID=53468 RepID=A0A0R3UC96_MESCO|nr:unnamed protein product [Mesocestoides corti]